MTIEIDRRKVSIAAHHGAHRPRAVMCLLLAGLLASGSVSALGEVVPTREKIVALAFDTGSSTLFKAYPKALYRSDSEGRDWSRIPLPKAIDGGRIVSIAVAAKSRGSLYVAGPGLGVLRSVDGGRSWVAKNDGLPSKEIAALASHADLPTTVYVYVTGRGIFRSEDAGEKWRLMDAGPRHKVLQVVHSNMPGSMQTGWFFAATAKGVSRSMDCFCGWRDAGDLGQAVTAVAYDPQQPMWVYAAAEAALSVSADGGEHWSQARSPGRKITALVATPAQMLYAAVGKGEIFSSADHGITWRQVDE